MSRNALIAVIIVVVAIAGFFAYQAAQERDESTLDISVSKEGVKVD